MLNNYELNQSKTLPWFAFQRSMLLERFHNNALHHAMLFVGPKRIGKYQFVRDLAGFLLCWDPSKDEACGKCCSCSLFLAKTHSDYLEIVPLKEQAGIYIDQSREILSFLQNKPVIGSKRIVVIDRADFLNLAASNALLKALEEPPINTIFLLTADNLSYFLPTVISRLFKVECYAPTVKEMMSWLASVKQTQQPYLDWLAVSPLLVLYFLCQDLIVFEAMIKDLDAVLCENQHPIAIAENWQKYSFLDLLDWWVIILYLLTRCQTSLLPALPGVNLQYLFDMVKKVKIDKLWGFSDVLYDKIRLLSGQKKLNMQLVFESLLIQWVNVKIT